VLQAGIQQMVDSNGQASYFAWWEWFVPGADLSQFYYVKSQRIADFLVSPGDKIYCCVAYVRNHTAGQLYLANRNTGKLFSIIIAPPTGANFNANSIEWIMEAPDGGEPISALPNFTQVNFFQAFGWTTGDKAVGDPQNGDSLNIFNPVTCQTLTSASLGSLSVTINFIG